MEDRNSILWMPRWVLWLILGACVLVGEALVLWWAPADWGLLRELAFGLVLGGFSFLCLFASRVIMG